MMTAHSQPTLRGELRHDEPLHRYTTWRVGGPAKQWYRPADADDLANFVAQLPDDEPLLWLGLGSNLLVRDGGFAGTVISTQGGLGHIEQAGATQVRAEAGAACAKVAKFCARRGLVGAEFLAGIPGSMGGALAMNAGAFGGETWERVSAVETLARDGARHMRDAKEFDVGYRTVRGRPEEWFLAAYLELDTGDVAAGQAKIKSLLERRGQTQPIGLPSCGSVFRNPPRDHAARLIEAAGLKGLCVGGACVSEKHANFIINTGAASAEDIERLIYQVRITVERVHGITLHPEVCIVGERR